MANKIALYFFTTLFLFFVFTGVQAQNTVENSLGKVGKSIDNLKITDKIPTVQDVSLTVSAIKNAAATYQSVKTQIVNAINYCQKAIQSANDIWERINSDWLKIKNYIEAKIGYVSKGHEINSPLS